MSPKVCSGFAGTTCINDKSGWRESCFARHRLTRAALQDWPVCKALALEAHDALEARERHKRAHRVVDAERL
jgi:hypothetical protein